MRSQTNSTPWVTFFFALLGLIWCGYVAFPTSNPMPCATSGCALFRDSKFAGISLWWVGGAYFFLLAVLCLKGNRHLARMLAMLALFVDAVLLIIMFLTAPCFDCLVVAAIMGLCYYSLKPASNGWFAGVNTAPSLLLSVWFGLFLGNSVLAAHEQFPLHAIGNTRSSEVRLYFSPSCKACREAINSLGNTATLYPIMENERDFDAIIRLSAMLKTNVPVHEAILRSIDESEPVPPLSFYERTVLALQLLRNKASLLRQGFRALPLVQVNGWPGETPSSLEKPATPAAQKKAEPALPAQPQTRSQEPLRTDVSALPYEEGAGSAEPGYQQSFNNGSTPDFLADPDALEQCGGHNAKPCD